MHEITNVVSYWLYLLVIITNNRISLTTFRSVVNRRPFASVEHFVVKCASFPEETLGDIIFTMRIVQRISDFHHNFSLSILQQRHHHPLIP